MLQEAANAIGSAFVMRSHITLAVCAGHLCSILANWQQYWCMLARKWYLPPGSSIGQPPSGKGDDINSSALTELKELLWSDSSIHVVTGSSYIAGFVYSQVEMSGGYL